MRIIRLFANKLHDVSPATGALVLALLIVGCAAAGASGLDRVDDIMNSSKVRNMLPSMECLPTCSADFNNYVKDAKRSADPNTIQYCTIFPATPGSKPFTIPIVGDMTSSSVSFFPTERAFKPGDDGGGEYAPVRRSYDGMYHGSPPPYRYGFDAITDAEHKIVGDALTWCTDVPQPSQIQDTTLNVTMVTNGKQLTNQINAALKRGDRSGAAAAVAKIGDLKVPNQP